MPKMCSSSLKSSNISVLVVAKKSRPNIYFSEASNFEACDFEGLMCTSQEDKDCSGVDMYTTLAVEVGALCGLLHGEANEVCCRVMGETFEVYTHNLKYFACEATDGNDKFNTRNAELLTP
ncbi:hypothetical protein Tco_0526197 [Tanacetum coccineum]